MNTGELLGSVTEQPPKIANSMYNNIEGKVVVITGASSELGEAIESKQKTVKGVKYGN
jgi:hypothetical protein